MKCPKCGENLSYLKHYESGEMKFHVSLDEHGDAEYDEQDFSSNMTTHDFECPYCQAVLTTEESEAKKLLQEEVKISKIQIGDKLV